MLIVFCDAANIKRCYCDMNSDGGDTEPREVLGTILPSSHDSSSRSTINHIERQRDIRDKIILYNFNNILL